MRTFRTFCAIAVVISCLALAERVRADNDEEALRQTLNTWAQAFRAHDLDAVMAMYAPDVVAYDIVPPLQYIGAAAYRNDYAEFLNQYVGPVETELRDEHFLVDGNLAVVMALERMSGTLKSGEKSDLWVRVTSCFRKVEGKWLDFHDHISVPTDFATGKAAVGLEP